MLKHFGPSLGELTQENSHIDAIGIYDPCGLSLARLRKTLGTRVEHGEMLANLRQINKAANLVSVSSGSSEKVSQSAHLYRCILYGGFMPRRLVLAGNETCIMSLLRVVEASNSIGFNWS